MKSGSILDVICAEKRVDLEAEKAVVGFDEMLQRAQGAAVRACFKDALKKASGVPNVIAELKKASPSRGLIRADFDARKLAVELENAGASALSVLTERRHFLGGDENLSAAAQAVKIPLLCKDFIFDKYQICKARVLGASAVLLIARILDDSELAELLAFAKSLSLDALCEVHTEEEIARVVGAGAEIVGVNCRNLKSFETDFSITERLLGRVPAGVVRVAESAIEDNAMLLRARDAGADAALIGTSIMAKKNPAEALKALIGR